MGKLSAKEACLVLELTRGPASTDVLADALGCLEDWPAAKFRVHATVQRIRAKFGPEVIETLTGGGYRLSEAALGVPAAGEEQP